MSALAVWLQGVRRVRKAKSLVLLLWLVTMAVTIPPAIELHDAINAGKKGIVGTHRNITSNEKLGTTLTHND